MLQNTTQQVQHKKENLLCPSKEIYVFDNDSFSIIEPVMPIKVIPKIKVNIDFVF